MTHWVIADVGSIMWLEFYGRAGRDPKKAIRLGLSRIRAIPGIPVFCNDVGPYNRAALLPGYKSDRKERDGDEKQMQDELRKLPAVLRKARIPNVLALSGFEADDHMAEAALAVPKTDRAQLFTTDRDLFQCVSRRHCVVSPMTARIMDSPTFREWYGLHPSEWAEVKAIAGCSTDCVPGVEGVGEVTAAKYLNGKLNRLGTLYAKITHFVTTPEYVRNLALVRLPFAGTPPVDLDPAPPDWARIEKVVRG